MEDVYFALEARRGRTHPVADGPRPPAIDGSDDVNWPAIRAIVGKDLTAVRRSKAVVLPMLLVPDPAAGRAPARHRLAARAIAGRRGAIGFLDALPVGPRRPDRVAARRRNSCSLLVLGYLLAPLFLIVPLMVSAVLAADAFAGEKERRTMESLLHLPIADRDLFIAKLLTGFLPALAVSWIGFVVLRRRRQRGRVAGHAPASSCPPGCGCVMIFWVAPAVAALGLGVMVRVSARAEPPRRRTNSVAPSSCRSSSSPSVSRPACCSSTSGWRSPSGPASG